MSWFHTAAQAGAGFLLGAAAAVRDPAGTLAWAVGEAAQELAGCAPYDFVSHMRGIAGGLNLEVTSLDNEMATWNVPFRGTNYSFSISHYGERLLFMAISAVRFRSGRLPRPVVELLHDRNRQLEYWQWDAATGERGSFFALKGFFNTAGVTGEIVAEAISRMVAETAAVDNFMVEHGFAR
jgi:hypothetical protein